MFHVPNQCRVRTGPMGTSEAQGNNGAFFVNFQPAHRVLRVIASDGQGWEHVSVSLTDRCPTWEEMCFVKKLFWDDTDCVVQYHPPASEYVNCHPYCLHLWRQIGVEFVLPPSYMVGPK